MISRGFLILEIASLIALRANGHTNPLFVCHRREATHTEESYRTVINQRDEIVVNNCTSTLIRDIIGRIYRTHLRTRPIRLHTSPATLDDVGLENATTDLDLSGNDLFQINLEKFGRLRTLNLTSNNVRSLRAVRLARNVSLTMLDLSRNRLLKLEHASIPATRRLSLRSNNIIEVERNVTLPESLRLLDLTRNEIENVSSVTFRSRSLLVLNLSINLINAVSRATFEHLPALEVLVLECNKIFEIEEGTFSRNPRLTELNLRDNNLSVLKKGVFTDLANLRVLDISKNDLLKLTPDTVQSLNNLAVFAVSENLKLCDAECKHDLEFLLVLGGRLRVLKMDRLRLRQFPVVLTTSVRLLDLSKNKLKRVQQGCLENFPFLESLTLSGNDIETTESDVFARMEFLETLRLDDNKLKRVPAVLPRSLHVLHLDRNRIPAIEKNDFCGLANLKTLKLNSNRIRSVESGAFRFLDDLETLDISDNPIARLSTDAFEGPAKLQTLYASGLKHVGLNATDVRYFPISEMPNLRKLNLSRSPELVRSFLADVPLLATVKQLEVADFSYADLTRVPYHLDDFLPRLKSLVLLGNPLNCTDNWLRNWRRPYDLDAVREIGGVVAGLKIRVAREPTAPSYERIVVESRCRFAIADVATVSNEEFWSSVRAINDTQETDTQPPQSRTIKYRTFESSTVGSTRKRNKLNSRSLHEAKFSSSQGHSSSPMNATGSTEISETPSPISRLPFDGGSSHASVSTKVKTLGPEDTAGRTTSSSNVTSMVEILARSISPPHSGHANAPRSNSTATALTFAISEDEVARRTDAQHFPTNELPFTSPKFAARAETQWPRSSPDNATPAPTSEYPSNAFAARTGVRRTPYAHAHVEALVWNRTDDRVSFFDWFPALNESADLGERAAALDDNAVEYGHPGLVIFSVVTCFLIAVFLSLVVPPCIQRYKWRRRRYKASELDNECQTSIEISSVSAFVETEISLE